MKIEVTIPLAPDNTLFHNSRSRRGGFYKGVHASQECRATARYAAMASGMHIEPFAGPVAVTIHAAYGYKRVTPDLDATISACKPYLDGIVDAGILVDDDQIQKITATHTKIQGKHGEKPQGYTRIQIEEIL